MRWTRTQRRRWAPLRWLLVGCTCIAVLWGATGVAGAEVTEYSSGLSAGAAPNGIAAGPDGAMWFTEWSGRGLGRIAPDGTIAEFPPAGSPQLTVGADPSGIVTGPDGNLWFTEHGAGQVGELDPSTGQLLGEWAVGSGPEGIAVGSDGALWIALNGPGGRSLPQIVQVIPNAGGAPTITAYPLTGTPGLHQLVDLVSGPDGDLWVTDSIGGVWRVDPGQLVGNPSYSPGFFALPGAGSSLPEGIAVDSSHRFLWVALDTAHQLAQIDPDAVVEGTSAGIYYYTVPGTPLWVSSAGDGGIWMTDNTDHRLIRFDSILETSTTYGSGQGVSGDATADAVDADGNLWFTEFNSDRVGEVAFTPENLGAPRITGTASPGETLSCSTGSWGPSPASYAYAWRSDGSAIAAASAATYVVAAGDVGHTLTCAVTATLPGGGSASAVSAGVAVADLLPVSTAAPAIAGTVEDGLTVTCSNGAWTNSPTGYSYQWLTNGVSITGATNQSYAIQPSDYGRQLSCEVTATNAYGSATAASAAVAVDHQPPVNTTAPSITGSPQAGGILTCHPGTWTGSPTFTFLWTWQEPATWDLSPAAKTPVGIKVRPTSLLSVTAAETAAFGDAGTLTVPDVPASGPSQLSPTHVRASTLTCTVTAHYGTHVPTAAASVAMKTLAPTLATKAVKVRRGRPRAETIAPPHIDPTVGAGGGNLCRPGRWAHYPYHYSYAWFAISARRSVLRADRQLHKGPVFAPTVEDEGKDIECVVTAYNSAGTGTAVSNHYVVPSSAAENTSAPTVQIQTLEPTGASTAITSGEAIAEQITLTCSPGQWNRPDLHFQYQWVVLNATGEAVTINDGVGQDVSADGGVLTLDMRPGKPQVDATVACQVTATTHRGVTSEAFSGPIHVWNGCVETLGTSQGDDYSEAIAEAVLTGGTSDVLYGAGAVLENIGIGGFVGWTESASSVTLDPFVSSSPVIYTTGPNCSDYQQYYQNQGYTVKQR